MYAVIETGGKQLRVEEGSVIYVEKLEVNEGETYTFRVQFDCGGGWSGSSTVTLPESMDMFATIPYTHDFDDFEDLDENANWTITNNSYNNRWFIGDPANVEEGGNCRKCPGSRLFGSLCRSPGAQFPAGH